VGAMFVLPMVLVVLLLLTLAGCQALGKIT
jgi:hypothetical protein